MLFKSLISFAFLCLISASKVRDIANAITDQVSNEMISIGKSIPNLNQKEKVNIENGIIAIQDNLTPLCILTIKKASDIPSSSKMGKMTTAFKAIKLMEIGYVNISIFAMHPELLKKMNTKNFKRDLTDIVSSMDKRGFGRKSAKNQMISEAEIKVLEAGLKVFESDSTLESVMKAL